MRQKKGRFVYLEISGYLPAQVNEEQADRRRFEDENGPLLDRADRQGYENKDRAEPPKDDVPGQFMLVPVSPEPVSYEKMGEKKAPSLRYAKIGIA